MLDVAILRHAPDELAAAMKRRGLDPDVDALAEVDRRRREARSRAEELRAEQKQIGNTIKQLDGDEKQAAIAKAGAIADDYKAALAEADELDAAFEAQWVVLPNMADPSAADGMDEDDAVELSRWGEPPALGDASKDHIELGEALGLVDMERAAKVSGSRFGLLTGAAVLIEFGLVRWVLDRLGSEPAACRHQVALDRRPACLAQGPDVASRRPRQVDVESMR